LGCSAKYKSQRHFFSDRQRHIFQQPVWIEFRTDRHHFHFSNDHFSSDWDQSFRPDGHVHSWHKSEHQPDRPNGYDRSFYEHDSVESDRDAGLESIRPDRSKFRRANGHNARSHHRFS
jgi:hypothetical protein